MKHLISIVEIPVIDFERAVTFYSSVLGINIEKMDMDGTLMGIFLTEEESTNICLIKDENVQPSANGTMVYFNTETDLQPVLERIEPSGGKILLPKTEISPEMGYFALFLDTEGNKIGLHSEK
ncbi:VOC family protein [Capnocytophaga stomatis]|uniref:Glyoxalase-like domain protein n=1 Tax=Capnocytophaga stomatis TaxID=1848904 RepID=A0A250FWB7_9FLAO|nr:VOC family protein [Capnocytophaga stomatis]ATA89383.1 glyoxalase-like domain protein [Capnocytophaga stomatis]GIJ93566.1 glyoxalase [Capnocytophaga stomatis]GIJ97252.1 glyoxalase [Capnocytophaga stomatis]